MPVYMVLYLDKAESRLSFILRKTFEYTNDELCLFREFLPSQRRLIIKLTSLLPTFWFIH